MKNFLDKLHLPSWIILVLALVLVLRIPSFLEPFSYGDEMIYLSVGEGIKHGLPLYSGIYDNKPPLLYLLAALAGNVFWFKTILAFWSLATIVLFWKLSEKLFPNKTKVQKTAVVIFALLTTLPLLEGNIANAENFMIGPIVAAFLLLMDKKGYSKDIFVAGVLFGIAALFKIPAAFDLLVIIVFWLVISGLKKEALKDTFTKSLYLVAGFLVPICISLAWFLLAGNLGDYIRAAFLQNIGYLSSWRPQDINKPFSLRNLPLLIRLGIVAVGVAILFLKRSKLSNKFIFLTVWTFFGLFAATLSERPYPHYLLQIAAPLSFLFAILFAEKSLEQSLVILPIVLVFFASFYFKFWYYSTSGYYSRFIKFAVGKSSREEYLASFGRQVPTHYEIARFLASSTNPSEKIFVWGPDSSAVYALSRRLPPGKFVADYHINDFSSKEKEVRILENNPPKFIIILPEAGGFPQLLSFLKKSYMLIFNINEAEVWRLKGSVKAI